VGTPVEIQRLDKGTISGTITSVANTNLVLTLKNQTSATVERENITRLYLTGKRHVAQDELIGGALGAGAGAGIGTALCGGIGCTKGQGAGGAAGIFGAVGALIGTAIGTHRGRELIYQSPKEASPGLAASAKVTNKITKASFDGLQPAVE
jgi:hypothetical protein